MARLTRHVADPAESRPDDADPALPDETDPAPLDDADPGPPDDADEPSGDEPAGSSGTQSPAAAAEPSGDETAPAPVSDESPEDGSEAGGDESAGPGGAGGGGSAGGPRGGRRGPGRPDRRVIVAAVVAVVSLALAAVLAFTSRSGGDDGGGEDAASTPATPSTSMQTGGIDVPTPDGWSPAPVPQLGFGIAYPPGWEAVVLEPEMLNSLTRSDPSVTGFVEAAHAAAQAGSVFYAAGEDEQGRVTDLKIRAAPESGVSDAAGLEDYARQVAAEPGVRDPEIERVDGAEHPTVRVGFRSISQSEDGERVTAHGVETLILAPDGVVWSLIVIGEDAALVDDLTPRLVDTFTLAPA